MRYYMHNIGDWVAHTAHLSWHECAAYHKLVEAYYLREQPLPGSVTQVCRIVGAVTHNECNAVRSVLREFFVRDDARDCWHQKRCDEEIAKNSKYNEQQRIRAAKRWGNTGTIATSKKAIEQAESILDSIAALHNGFPRFAPPRTSANGNALASDAVGIPAGNAPAMPLIKHKTLNTSNTHTTNVAHVAAETARVCVEKGLKVDESDSLLLALIHRGASVADFAEAASLAAAQGKKFAYAAGIVNNRLSVASEYAREGTKSSLGSIKTTDPRSAYFLGSKNRS